MKKLVLNEFETFELLRDGEVLIVRNGFEILVEQEYIYETGEYLITIINPYDKIVMTEIKGVKK